MGWKNYQRQRAADEERRKKERANAEKKAARCSSRPRSSERRRPRPPPRTRWSRAPRSCSPGLEDVRSVDRVAKLRFPTPAPCGRTPLQASDLRRATARSRSSPPSTSPSTAAPRWSCSGSTARARRPCCGCSRASTGPTPARSSPGHGLRIGYYAQEHETIDVKASRAAEHGVVVAEPDGDGSAPRARLVPVHRATTRTSRPGCSPAARRPVSRWR